MNWKQLLEMVRQGYGQGHLDAYRPWLFLRRRNSSKRGNQVSGDLPGYLRQTSFLARIEWYFALLMLWLGALDVREQFPLWPMRHLHPLADFPGSPRPGQMGGVPGLMEIAHEAGIDHGWQVGRPDVPYVATVDLAVTRQVDGKLALAMLAAKPRDEVESADPASRLVERLVLQRRYATEANSTFAIVHANLIGEQFGSNLENFKAAAVLPGHLSHRSLISDFSAFVSEVSASETLQDAVIAASTRFKLHQEEASLLFRAAVWRRLIDVDLSEYIVMSYPRKSGAALVAALERELFPA